MVVSALGGSPGVRLAASRQHAGREGCPRLPSAPLWVYGTEKQSIQLFNSLVYVYIFFSYFAKVVFS